LSAPPFGRRLNNRQHRLQCLPQFTADVLSCHATYNAQGAWRDNLVFLRLLAKRNRNNCIKQLDWVIPNQIPANFDSKIFPACALPSGGSRKIGLQEHSVDPDVPLSTVHDTFLHLLIFDPFYSL